MNVIRRLFVLILLYECILTCMPFIVIVVVVCSCMFLAPLSIVVIVGRHSLFIERFCFFSVVRCEMMNVRSLASIISHLRWLSWYQYGTYWLDNTNVYWCLTFTIQRNSIFFTAIGGLCRIFPLHRTFSFLHFNFNRFC